MIIPDATYECRRLVTDPSRRGMPLAELVAPATGGWLRVLGADALQFEPGKSYRIVEEMPGPDVWSGP